MREAEPERIVYGQTGIPDVDGILTPAQQQELDQIQEDAADASLEYLDNMGPEDKYPLVAMATGVGKGRVAHLILERRFEASPNSQVLIVAGAKNILVDQTHKALGGYQESGDIEEATVETEAIDIDEEEILRERSFLYRTGPIKDPDANVKIATIQTVRSAVSRELVRPEEYDLTLIDEVHNVGTTLRQDVIRGFKRIGFTATPFRHSGRMRSPEDYGFTVIRSLTLPEAQEKRFLPPLVGMQFDTTGLVDEVPMTRTGLIDFKELEKILKRSPDLRSFIAKKIASVIVDPEGRRYKTAVVVNYVWEAEEIAEELLSLGIRVGIAVNQSAARRIHSERLPTLDSTNRIKLHQDDERSIQLLISPYIAGEGFDVPAIEAIFWASPTDSSLRYTQYTGRLARRANGKRFGVIGDFLYQTSQYSWSYNMGMWMKGSVRQLENGLLYLGPEADIEYLKNLPVMDNLSRQSDVKPMTDLQKEGLIEVLDTDFPITQSSLEATFRGKYERVKQAVEEIVESIRLENPELIIRRTNSNNIIQVVTDRDKIIGLMLNKGFELKDETLEEVQDTDFPISQVPLMNQFSGKQERVRILAERAAEEIRLSHPELVVRRRIPVGVIIAVADRSLFINTMVKLGAKIKERRAADFPEIKETDFAITTVSLGDEFRGGSTKLRPLANRVLEKLASSSPKLIEERRSSGAIVKVITDRAKFIEEMIGIGAARKNPNLEEIQDNDIIITPYALTAIFKGGHRKLSKVVKEIISYYEHDNPVFLAARKSSIGVSPVFTDRDLFIQEMITRGVQLQP